MTLLFALKLKLSGFRPFTGFPIKMFADSTPTFFPAVWFETTTELPEDLASQLRLLEYVYPNDGDDVSNNQK